MPACLRLLKRRIIILIAFALVCAFLLMNVIEKTGFRKFSDNADFVVERKRPLIWRSYKSVQQEHVLPDDTAANREENNRTNDFDIKCRNSIQGLHLIVDDRGFLCQRKHMLSNGCCNVEVPETLFYTCQTCNTTTHCCAIYEYCVSCCLHPERRPLLELVLRTITGRQSAVFSTVEDHFELCLVKCRTNSHSVEHENKYRDAKLKHCYGKTEAHESQREVLENFVR